MSVTPHSAIASPFRSLVHTHATSWGKTKAKSAMSHTNGDTKRMKDFFIGLSLAQSFGWTAENAVFLGDDLARRSKCAPHMYVLAHICLAAMFGKSHVSICSFLLLVALVQPYVVNQDSWSAFYSSFGWTAEVPCFLATTQLLRSCANTAGEGPGVGGFAQHTTTTLLLGNCPRLHIFAIREKHQSTTRNGITLPAKSNPKQSVQRDTNSYCSRDLAFVVHNKQSCPYKCVGEHVLDNNFPCIHQMFWWCAKHTHQPHPHHDLVW